MSLAFDVLSFHELPTTLAVALLRKMESQVVVSPYGMDENFITLLIAVDAIDAFFGSQDFTNSWVCWKIASFPAINFQWNFVERV